ncbi:MAG TPA: DUF1186 domain-containing protein [Flavobacteriales bacterium]|nr:DUF1186 domain-containing protein [Flavobacteriales bacterium]
MRTLYSPTGHLAHLTITDSEDLRDARYGIDTDQRTEIAKTLDLARSGLASAGKYIRKQAQRYPGNPVFLNHLAAWHDIRGEQDQAIAVIEQTAGRFPDYLFAQTSLADVRMSEGRAEEALQHLGPALRIEERFPGHAEFHIYEVEAYEHACLKYLMAVTHELDRARERLEALRSVSDNEEWLDKMSAQIAMGASLKSFVDHQAQLEEMPRINFDKQPESPHAGRELVLHNPELNVLMERSMDLMPEEVQALLALPRETLVQDLTAIVQHGIDRFHHYKEHLDELWNEDLCFVHHALILLGERPGADSLEAVLLALSQSSEYSELFLGDWLTEDVWTTVANLAEGQLDRLDAFMRTPRLHAFGKVVVSEAICQLGLHRPELLPAIEEWYAGLLAFYTAAQADEEVMDATLLGMMVGDILELGLSSLLPAVEALYARGIVPSFVCGSIETVREEFAKPKHRIHKREMLDVEARYAELADAEERAWEDEEDTEDEDDAWPDAPPARLPITRSAPKVGRNDPCPCGSGKKYKKCCEGKEVARPWGLTLPR